MFKADLLNDWSFKNQKKKPLSCTIFEAESSNFTTTYWHIHETYIKWWIYNYRSNKEALSFASIISLKNIHVIANINQLI